MPGRWLEVLGTWGLVGRAGPCFLGAHTQVGAGGERGHPENMSSRLFQVVVSGTQRRKQGAMLGNAWMEGAGCSGGARRGGDSCQSLKGETAQPCKEPEDSLLAG